MNSRFLAVGLVLVLLSGCDAGQQSPDAAGAVEAADLLLVNGYIYTVDDGRNVEQALAVRDGLIVAVGDDEAVAPYRGEETEVIDLAGRMVLPGLHDIHMHVFGIVEPDVCSLRSEAMSLEDMVPYLDECIRRYDLAPGEWLAVDMWNFSEGNQVSEALPDLRTALDAVSTEHPIILWGNDGHHGAVNSAALALARDEQGNVVGLSAETLAGPFKDLLDLVGVNDDGEPNGELNEHARNVVGSGPRRDPEKLAALLPQIGEELARNGITSVQDAALDPVFLPYLKAFEEAGDMRFRVQVANRVEPMDYQDPLTGSIDIDQMLEDVGAAREAFTTTLIDPSAVKIFADGVLEGNPYATPPTLPNAATIEAYRQPLFEYDPEAGEVRVRGYVDTASPVCEEVRASAERFESKAARDAFRAEHGFHPGQCAISYGVMADPEPFINAYVRRLDEAGFTIHIHAIGDRAVRAAADALQQVVPADGSNPARHTMAHLQLVHPDDQRRIGEMGLYLAWTYAWMLTVPAYDMTVMPFLGDVTGPDGIYDPDSYWMRNSYPVRSMAEAGAVTAAGSDAPVDDRSPRPFVNMAVGVTRQGLDGNVLNAAEAVDIDHMIAAYTINGARALKQEAETGSIEPGKKADLAILDRNIVDLYQSGDAMDIAETRVDLTVFEGEVIYRRQ
ncbi:amidohydrolase [Elongatibacter sediminis]|uniref:Amidohydrolase family protein n=1 Tax=Elongatibacter sediminis TaxID=3119006 RepID=A0AAW9RG56_9GAMM